MNLKQCKGTLQSLHLIIQKSRFPINDLYIGTYVLPPPFGKVGRKKIILCITALYRETSAKVAGHTAICQTEATALYIDTPATTTATYSQKRRNVSQGGRPYSDMPDGGDSFIHRYASHDDSYIQPKAAECKPEHHPRQSTMMKACSI